MTVITQNKNLRFGIRMPKINTQAIVSQFKKRRSHFSFYQNQKLNFKIDNISFDQK